MGHWVKLLPVILLKSYRFDTMDLSAVMNGPDASPPTPEVVAASPDEEGGVSDALVTIVQALH